MNSVAKYRQQAKLSQRALALSVGVSQQTIQRIESEAVTVRFEVAVALSRALGVPLRNLFPDLRAKLPTTDPQKPEESIDYSHCSHSLKIMFQGGPERFYDVDEATARRVRSALHSECEFICFDTQRSRVVINSDKILWINILFDPGIIVDEDEEGDEGLLGPMVIFFDGGDQAHEFEIDPDTRDLDFENLEERGSELQLLMMDLESAEARSEPMSFIDGDGEEVIFYPARMKAAEVPIAAINPKLFKSMVSGMLEDEAEGTESDILV
ncbi:helix-turn-helix transcriptional regulator [Caulobacter segnis]